MVRSPNWNQIDIARTIPTAFKAEVGRLLASLQRLTGIGVWPYDISYDGPWQNDEAERIHGLDVAAMPTVSDVVEQHAEGDQDGVLVHLGGAIEHGESFAIDVQCVSE